MLGMIRTVTEKDIDKEKKMLGMKKKAVNEKNKNEKPKMRNRN